jgi:hypothetical protein
MNNDVYEPFRAELLKNIRQTITWQRAIGVLAMSKENLMQVTPRPKESIGPVGTNARWIYHRMFDDTLACLPRANRVFVHHNESILGAVLGQRDDGVYHLNSGEKRERIGAKTMARCRAVAL